MATVRATEPRDLKRRQRQRRSPRQRGAPRKKTVTIKMTRPVLLAGWVELGGRPAKDPWRPRTWGECAPFADACPYVACRHHLYLEINPDTGAITFNHPDREPHELEHSCSLAVAESGGQTLETVGDLLNITRERVRQIEVRVIVMKLKGTVQLRSLGVDGPLG